LLFAVLVILSHSFPLTRSSNVTEPLSVLTRGQITFGNISVWSFFVISGILITQSWQRSPRVWDFLRRRVGRIYPGFAVAALFTGLLVVPVAADPGTFVPISLRGYLQSVLCLRDLNPSPVFTHNPLTNTLNGSLWSVAYEFWCYLGVLMLGVVGLLRQRFFLVLALCTVIGLHLYMEVSGWKPSGGILGLIVGYPPFWATLLPFFLAGMILHVYGGQSLLRRRYVIAASVLLVVSGFVPRGFVVTMPTCGAYLLLALAYLPALTPINLSRWGDFSYGTYLYAFPIQQLLVQRARGQIAPWLLFAESAPLTLIAAALSWHLVEKRFLFSRSQIRHEGLEPSSITTAHHHSPSPQPITTAHHHLPDRDEVEMAQPQQMRPGHFDPAFRAATNPERKQTSAEPQSSRPTR
jgi:peptidoglycan/LPS O-acetylase OafA/YrhL